MKKIVIVIFLIIVNNGVCFTQTTFTSEQQEFIDKIHSLNWEETMDILPHNSEFLKDKKVVLEVVKKYGFALDYVDSKFWSDKEVMLVALSNYGRGLGLASKELRNDLEVVLTAVKNDGSALSFASEELRNNHMIVAVSISNQTKALVPNDYCGALQYASEKLKDNKDIVLASILFNYKSFDCASDRLKKDPDIKKLYKKQSYKQVWMNN